MKFLYVSILCLVLCQCKNPDTGDITPETTDNTSKTGFKSVPTIISQANSIGWDVALDNANNVFISGSFAGTTAYGTSAGNYDVFVAKYNPAGELQWARTLGGTKTDEGRGVAIDDNGNVYVTGDFYGTISTGDKTVTSNGDADAFLAKFSNDGEPLWLRNYGSDGGERGHALAVDGQGNVYATGEFQGTGIFGDTRQQAMGEFDAYIVKYNADGEFQWVQSGGGSKRDTGYGIATDAHTGEVYVTGFFIGTTTFGNTSATAPETWPGEGDVFLAKYNSEGAFQWMRTSEGKTDGGGWDVTVDGSGNVFLVKRNSTKGHLVKYDAQGVSQWERVLKFDVDGMGVAADNSGNVYVVNSNAAILKYNPTGELQQAQLPRGSESISGTGIAVNKNGKVFISGHYKGTLTYDSISKTDGGWINMFAIGGDL